MHTHNSKANSQRGAVEEGQLDPWTRMCTFVQSKVSRQGSAVEWGSVPLSLLLSHLCRIFEMAQGRQRLTRHTFVGNARRTVQSHHARIDP